MTSHILWAAEAGGLLAFLTFWHFFFDILFQTHADESSKTMNMKGLFKHCFIYTVGMLFVISFLCDSWWKVLAIANILFWSHAVEDLYIPVAAWIIFYRKPPFPLEEYLKTKDGFLLSFVVDQLIHLSFLLGIVVLILV